MSTDSSNTTTSDRHRRLAELVDRVDDDGVEVETVESHTTPDGKLRSTLKLRIGPVPSTTAEADAEEAAGDDSRGVGDDYIGCEGGLRDELEEFEAEQAADDDEGPETGEATVSETMPGIDDSLEDDEAEESETEDVDEADDDPETDEEDQPHPEDLEAEEDPEPPEDSLAAEILAALRDEGELAGPEIKTITGAGTDMYSALGELQDDDLVEKRQDPEDGRRTLYRPAGWLVQDDDEEEDGPEWNGRDPKEIVADSSLPAHLVLEDILEGVTSVDTVIDLAEQLDVDVDNLEPVCWELTLKQSGSYEVVDDVDERVETVREVVEA